ncbi:MAG: hypothetical protein O9306_08455 [Beijerinckiaceae bacterium]|jgi:hypothetical protein|nr:hypothetical protein [Beijerinckiaceae bacterium]
MKRRIALCLVFAAVMANAPILNASTADLANAVNAAARPLWDRGFQREDRIEFAKKLLAYWESFHDRIPRLSPAEMAWASGEIKAGGARMERAAASREGALFFLNVFTKQCVDTHQDIVNSQTSPRGNETKAWVHSLECYHKLNSINAELDHTKLTGGIAFEKRNNDYNTKYISAWHFTVIHILISIIKLHDN